MNFMKPSAIAKDLGIKLPSLKVLVVDTETTGLPRKGDVYSKEQPWVIQLGAVLMDLAEDEYEYTLNTLVNPPEGVYFDPRAMEIHGLTEADIRRDGVDIVEVMAGLREVRRKAAVVSAYNLDFDERLIRSCSGRAHPDFKTDFVLGEHNKGVSHICIMKQSITALGARYKLEHVHRQVTGDLLLNAHDALADTEAAARIMKELLYADLLSTHKDLQDYVEHEDKAFDKVTKRKR
jgi:DNA polymerase III epsilon subunit-like protein